MTARYYWLSSMKMTIGVATDAAGTITGTAPIARKFIGQPLRNLTTWLERMGGFAMAELPAPRAEGMPR